MMRKSNYPAEPFDLSITSCSIPLLASVCLIGWIDGTRQTEGNGQEAVRMA